MSAPHLGHLFMFLYLPYAFRIACSIYHRTVFSSLPFKRFLCPMRFFCYVEFPFFGLLRNHPHTLCRRSSQSSIHDSQNMRIPVCILYIKCFSRQFPNTIHYGIGFMINCHILVIAVAVTLIIEHLFLSIRRNQLFQ